MGFQSGERIEGVARAGVVDVGFAAVDMRVAGVDRQAEPAVVFEPSDDEVTAALERRPGREWSERRFAPEAEPALVGAAGVGSAQDSSAVVWRYRRAHVHGAMEQGRAGR